MTAAPQAQRCLVVSVSPLKVALTKVNEFGFADVPHLGSGGHPAEKVAGLGSLSVGDWVVGIPDGTPNRPHDFLVIAII